MTNTLYGLTPYVHNSKTEMGFTNFQWVVPGKVARSSQPGYNNSADTIQSYSMVQIMFLKLKGIRCIISANQRGITAKSQDLLDSANIVYHHYALVDGSPPTAFHLQNAANQIEQTLSSGGGVLIYCGYGQGRTGTFVAGWAMLKCFDAGDRHRKMSRDQMCNANFLRANFGVEHDPQVAAIRAAAALPVVTTPAGNTGVNFMSGSVGNWAPPMLSAPQPFFNSGTSALGMPNSGSSSGTSDISF